MRKLGLTSFLITTMFFSNCNNVENKKVENIVGKEVENESDDLEPLLEVGMVGTIALQPYDDFDKEDVEYLRNHLVHELEYYNIVVLEPIDMPLKNKSVHRDRYRADSIIRDMKKVAKTRNTDIVLAFTTKDISTTSGKIKDWGVLGLGYRPGTASVVSSYRLKSRNGSKREELLKSALHELGHNLGLDHCPNKTCVMRDAKGKNNFDTSKDYCSDCKEILMNDVEKKWFSQYKK